MGKIYSMQEIADLLGYSIASIYSYERRGFIQRINDSAFEGQSGKFSEEQVNKLLEMKKKLDASGNSYANLAKTLGVPPGKVKEAVKMLKLDVKKVQTSLYSTRTRYALTAEQEQEIIKYFDQYKPGRPRRNALYYTHMDLAEHQLFQLNTCKKIRLQEDLRGRLGFELKDGFLPFKEAIEKYSLKPAYSIHQTQQEGKIAASFTDLIIPTQNNDFFEILDTLYSICGVENFNAEYIKERLFISIRNGNYSVTTEVGAAAKELIEQYIVFGHIMSEGNHLSFTQSKSVIEIQLDSPTYEIFSNEARMANLPIAVLIQRMLHHQASLLKK